MDKLIIRPSGPLQGQLRIAGAKNAALPILAACLLSDASITLSQIPQLQDITILLEMLGALGCRILIDEHLHVEIDSSTLATTTAPDELARTMRASFLLLGPLLSKHGHAAVSLPGGCAIGPRPVDLHIRAFEAMGASVCLEQGYVKATCNGRLKGAQIDLPTPTVTGTENILMAAALAEGETVINGAACEPEIADLAHFINEMGGNIQGAGTPCIRIKGVERLTQPVTHAIMPDRIEAGTYLTAAAMTQGSITLTHVDSQSMQALLEALTKAGAAIQIGDGTIHLDMHGQRPQAVSVTTAP